MSVTNFDTVASSVGLPSFRAQNEPERTNTELSLHQTEAEFLIIDLSLQENNHWRYVAGPNRRGTS